jgi:hypothetical protein
MVRDGQDLTSRPLRTTVAGPVALEARCTRVKYGCGFFAVAGYLNHSCAPNCLSDFIGGDTMVWCD